MSAKNLDSKGRFRSRTIGFRVSPEEEKADKFSSGTFRTDQTGLHRKKASLP